jgi:hypothetical protein
MTEEKNLVEQKIDVFKKLNAGLSADDVQALITLFVHEYEISKAKLDSRAIYALVVNVTNSEEVFKKLSLIDYKPESPDRVQEELQLGTIDCVLEEIAERKAFLLRYVDEPNFNQELVMAAYTLAQADYMANMSNPRTNADLHKTLRYYKALNSDDSCHNFDYVVSLK